tara:strand:- start:3798 stop:4007 length:210 start_codon:yes stop_codon:yes gene_type:complete
LAHYDLIGIFAKAQLDYPEGIGIKHSLFCVRLEVGKKDLIDCDRQELNRILNRCRDEYLFLKSKEKKPR